jgi:ABC-2 type transport system permease protein
MKTIRLLLAIAVKELRQIARDRLTAALLFGVPLAQLLLFGYAIELRPKSWPTAWVSSTYSQDIKTKKLSEKMLQESG